MNDSHGYIPPHNPHVRMLELDDAAWRATGRQRFEEAYCDEDVIYDDLAVPDGDPAQSQRF